jgi:hypothetical protein
MPSTRFAFMMLFLAELHWCGLALAAMGVVVLRIREHQLKTPESTAKAVEAVKELVLSVRKRGTTRVIAH